MLQNKTCGSIQIQELNINLILYLNAQGNALRFFRTLQPRVCRFVPRPSWESWPGHFLSRGEARPRRVEGSTGAHPALRESSQPVQTELINHMMNPMNFLTEGHHDETHLHSISERLARISQCYVSSGVMPNTFRFYFDVNQFQVPVKHVKHIAPLENLHTVHILKQFEQKLYYHHPVLSR